MKFSKAIMCIALFGACICSCQKESTTSNESDYKLVNGAEDLTCGMDVIIFNFDNYYDGIELGITGNIEAYGNNPDVEYVCETRDGKTYLIPEIKRNLDQPTIVDEVRLVVDGHRDLEKDVTVIIRDESQMSQEDINPENAVTDPIANRLVDVLGRGISPNDPIGVTKMSVFNKDVLVNMNKKHVIFDFTDTEKKTETFHKMASSFNSITKTRSIEIGLDVALPITKGIALSLGLSGNWSKSRREDNSYEYMTTTTKTVMAEGVINKVNVIGAGGWQAIMDTTLNNILNNPGSAVYKEFPTTPEGTYKLLDRYGTAFYLACQLGGSAHYEYSMRKRCTEENIMWGVGVEMAFTKFDPKASAPDNIATYLYNQSSNHIAGIKAKYGENTTNLFNSIDLEEKRSFHGGNAAENPQSCAQWKATDDPTKWVPIAYAKQSTLNTMEVTGNSDVLPIYELCKKVNSKRRKAIVAALTPDPETGVIPYFEYLHCYNNVATNRMVLADIYLECVEHNKPQKGDGEPKLMQTKSDGKWRMYYPMMQNPNAGFHTSDHGFPVDVQAAYFHGSHNAASSFFLYYALDWDHPGIGMTHIRLGKTPEVGEDTRGEYTDRHVPGDSAIGRIYIIARWANETTKAEDKITGFGFKYTDWDKDNKLGDKDLRGLVFASTGGTEWNKEYGFGGDNAKEYFDSYWGLDKRNSSYHLGESDGFPNCFVNMKHHSRPHTMHICYTKVPIKRDMSGYGTEDPGAVLDLKKTSAICIPYKYGVDPRNAAEDDDSIWENDDEDTKETGE